MKKAAIAFNFDFSIFYFNEPDTIVWQYSEFLTAILLKMLFWLNVNKRKSKYSGLKLKTLNFTCTFMTQTFGYKYALKSTKLQFWL